jgi:hypothetical protein
VIDLVQLPSEPASDSEERSRLLQESIPVVPRNLNETIRFCAHTQVRQGARTDEQTKKTENLNGFSQSMIWGRLASQSSQSTQEGKSISEIGMMRMHSTESARDSIQGRMYGAQLSPTPKKIGLKPSEQNFRGINEVKSLRNEMNGK